LGAYGVTPQPTLDEAILEAMRLLPIEEALAGRMRDVERCSIATLEQAQDQLGITEAIVHALRALSGEAQFPASFDTAAGWRSTLLTAYDWVNLGAHLDARFPQTTHGGHGTADEARDLLASCAR
jgi:hypothetical protein